MKKKFKVLIGGAVLLLALSLLGGCAGKKDDAAFLKNLQSGLEKRWDLTDNQPDSYGSNSDYKDALREFVNVEINAIGNLDEYEFEDTTLKNYATEYVEALNSQLEGIQYYGSNDTKYAEMFTTNGYNKRAEVLKDIVDNYDEFTVGSSYQNNLDDFVNTGRLYEEQDDMLNKFQELISSELSLESKGGTYYELKINNSTDYDLSGAQILFNFYDENGSQVSDTSSYIENCVAGATTTVDVYEDSTFATVKMAISLYNQKTSEQITTKYNEISYKNDMIVNVEMATSLPVEVNTLSYDGVINSTCKINEYSVTDEFWMDGKAAITINLSGEKTYESEDPYSSQYSDIGWKLRDENDVIVASGTAFTNAMAVGEKFANCEIYASDLVPGTYKLELMDAQ